MFRINKNTAFQNRSGGFSLIELMITIAILAILVALAVPAYTDYAVRSKVAECINGATVAKVQISEYRQGLGAWPPSDVEAGLNNPLGVSYYCAGFGYTVASGIIAIDVDELRVGGPGITGIIEPILTPADTASGIINWTCSTGSTSAENVKFLPSTCRQT